MAQQVLHVTESYRAAAEKAVQHLTVRLHRVENASTQRAGALAAATREASHWLHSAREGWLTARQDLERRHAYELTQTGQLIEASASIAEEEQATGSSPRSPSPDPQQDLALLDYTPTFAHFDGSHTISEVGGDDEALDVVLRRGRLVFDEL